MDIWKPDLNDRMIFNWVNKPLFLFISNGNLPLRRNDDTDVLRMVPDSVHCKSQYTTKKKHKKKNSSHIHNILSYRFICLVVTRSSLWIVHKTLSSQVRAQEWHKLRNGPFSHQQRGSSRREKEWKKVCRLSTRKSSKKEVKVIGCD